VRALRGYGLHKRAWKPGERFWESRPERVKAPYLKAEMQRQYPEYHGTRGTLWEVGRTTSQG